MFVLSCYANTNFIDRLPVIPTSNKVCLNYKFKDISQAINQELELVLNRMKYDYSDEILTCKKISNNILEFACSDSESNIISSLQNILTKNKITKKKIDKITYITVEFELKSLLKYIADRIMRIIQERCGINVNCSFEDNIFKIVIDKNSVDETKKLIEASDKFAICVIDISERDTGEKFPVYGGGTVNVLQKSESNHFKSLIDNVKTTDKNISIHLSKDGLRQVTKFSNISKYRSLYLGFLVSGKIFRPIPIKRDLIISSDVQLGEVENAQEAKFLANSINFGNISSLKFISETSFVHSPLEKLIAIVNYLLVILFGIYLNLKSRRRFLLFCAYVLTMFVFGYIGYSLTGLIVFLLSLPVVYSALTAFSSLLLTSFGIFIGGFAIKYLSIFSLFKGYSRFIPKIGLTLSVIGGTLSMLLFISAAFNFKWWKNNSDINEENQEEVNR